MHTYSSDAEDRKMVPTILAVLAIVATLLLNYIVQILKLSIPWWVDAPSVMGFYGLLYQLYDQLLWRVSLGPIHLSAIPNINGLWVGTLVSSYDETKTINVVAYIKQTWSRITFRLETATSVSYTDMAAFNTDQLSPSLRYEFLSEPGPFTKDTMHTHRGTGHLQLSSDNRIFSGHYYTGNDRQTFGTIELHFASKKVMNLEEALKLPKP